MTEIKDFDIKKVANNINAICKERNLEIKDLANLANLPITTLSPILNGKRDFRISTLLAIAKALNVSTDELIAGTYKKSSFLDKRINPPLFIVTFISNISFSYLQVLDIKKNLIQSVVLNLALTCTTPADNLIQEMENEIRNIIGDINPKYISVYASVLCFEYIDGRKELIEIGKKKFFQFMIEPDWLAIHQSMKNKNIILLVVNNGYAISYSFDNGQTINKRQGYSFPFSDEAGNIFIASEAIKHAINVKEKTEERTLLSEKILAFFLHDLNLITTKVYNDYVKTYTEVASIVKELAITRDKVTEKAFEIIKKSGENLLKQVIKIDELTKKKLPIVLAGDLSYLYKEFMPKNRLQEIEFEVLLKNQFDYLINLLKSSN